MYRVYTVCETCYNLHSECVCPFFPKQGGRHTPSTDSKLLRCLGIHCAILTTEITNKKCSEIRLRIQIFFCVKSMHSAIYPHRPVYSLVLFSFTHFLAGAYDRNSLAREQDRHPACKQFYSNDFESSFSSSSSSSSGGSST